MKILGCLLLALLCGCPAFSQTATLGGVVTDESGALISGATVTLTGSAGQPRQTTSGQDGSYSFANVTPGEYAIDASAPQLSLPQQLKVTVASAVQVVNLQLNIVATREEVRVEENAAPMVSTESAGNANAHVRFSF